MRFKRLLSGVVGVAVLAASLTAFAADFPDIKGHWSEDYVNSMVAEGYIKGYDDGTFKPDKTVSNTEALILLARMLGVDKSEYAVTADNALAAYSSALSGYTTEYKKEVSYLLYRGVIDESDLDTYILSSKKSQALLRYQCAMLLTKLLGADDEVESSVFISSSYSDTAQIPAEARPYVEYVRDAKIMEGMGSDSYGDPIFGPLESVTRGQMAKMLSSLIDVLDINTASGAVSEIDEFEETVKVGSKSYHIEADTLIKLDGEDAKLSDLANGMEAVVIVASNKVSMIEAVSAEKVEEPTRGVIVSATSGADGKTIVISDAEDTTKRSTYKVSDDARIIIEKAVDSFGKLKSNQYVELTLDGEIVTGIEVIDKNVTVVATLVSKSINTQTPTVTVENVKGEKATYICSADGVTVTRNGASSNLSGLVAGDSVTLKLVYNKVTKISAESETQNLSGEIISITHTKNGSALDVKVSDKTNTYSAGSETTIIIDGTEATVYDLRPGSEVNFKTESTLITRIESTKAVSMNKVVGTVKSVQSKYDCLFVDVDGEEVTVFIKSTTNIANGSTGSTMKLTGIKAGNSVDITGSNATGVFVATAIVVTQ